LTVYMLDTNILSDMIRNPAGGAVRDVRKVGESAICTSIVVAGELRYGCAKKGSAQLARKVDDLLAEMTILPLDVPVDAAYGTLRSQLEAAGQPIGANDLLIAAHACAVGAVLVTANVNEFSRIPGLAIENWLVD
jgi:tRNA(fMet)-specific endonuclease VapC